MSFADRIKETVARTATESIGEQWLTVLLELAQGLTSDDITAQILTNRRDRRQLSLFVFPAYRVQQGNVMLRFLLDNEGIVVSGSESRRINSTGELEDLLLEYVRLPAFIESLNTFKERSTEAVEARLATSSSAIDLRDAIMVWVQPSDQRRIFEAGGDIELDVERVEFPGNPGFDENKTYVTLNSAGKIVQVIGVSRNGDKIRIQGSPLRETWPVRDGEGLRAGWR